MRNLLHSVTRAVRRWGRVFPALGISLLSPLAVNAVEPDYAVGWDDLFDATRADAAEPDNREHQTRRLSSLSSNRVAGPALSLSEGMALSARQRRRLKADAAAELVRTSFAKAPDEKERFRVADKALARYEVLLADWATQAQARDDYTRARIDRLGALLVRKRYRDVINEYEALLAEGHELPDYALRWVASAHLGIQEPDQARVLFGQLSSTAGQPLLTLDQEQEPFWALLESERHALAAREANRIVETSPWQRYHFGSPIPQPNDRWLMGRHLQVNYLLAANDLPAAQALAGDMVSSAPGNQGIRIAHASVLNARGLPRAAERQLKIAEALSPSYLDLERAQAYVAMNLQEWRQMDLLTDDVMARSAEDLASRRLDHYRNVHRKYELRVSGSKGIQSDSPVSGSKDVRGSTVLYGPPMVENWRVFGGYDFASSEFDEGKGINQDVRGGIEWRSRDNWAEVEIANRHFHHGNKIGVRLSAWHDFSDHWRMGGSVERLSRSTPLRALRNGVTADSAEVFVRWYHNERREYRLSLASGRFSDGNDRFEYTLSGKERLWTTPRFTLDVLPTIAGSTNSEVNKPYYNPGKDITAIPVLLGEQVLHRRYDTVWTQQFMGGAGAYWQEWYGTGLISLLGYGQRIRWNGVLDAGVMLMWDKRPYDGRRERNLSIAFDMNFRF
jgi:biofilm PGA synthesis protein PgaA